jgi:ABC-type nitrate/sulfonate/bicarbonate transport system permease component
MGAGMARVIEAYAGVAQRLRPLLSLPLYGGSIMVLLIGWELLGRSGMFSRFLLPPLSLVLVRIADDAVSGTLLTDVLQTLYRTVIGFGISAFLGVVIGILIARVRVMHWLFDPIVSVGFPTPKIAFLPIFMLWFGVYNVSKIALIVFNATFPIIIATVAATQAVEKELIWSARSLGARKREVLWEIVLPAALPQIITGLQVALPIALVIAVVTELLMGGAGLGGTMIRATRFADSLGVFAGIVEVAVLGWLLIKGLELIRRRLLVWHPETQSISTV